MDDLRDDDRHGEILLDQTFVQVQGRLDKLLVIVPIVPEIKLAIEGISLLRVFFLLKFKQGFTILQTNRAKFRPQVVKELHGVSYLSGRIDCRREGTYRENISSSLNHLHFRDIIRPSGVSLKFCDLTTQIEDFIEQRSVDGQSIFESLLGLPTDLWVLCEFELENSELQG